jgi:hypothetical protein
MRKLLLAIAAFLCLAAAHAQTVTPIVQPFLSYLDASGNPCAGCKLYSYAAGTTTPLATYTDATGNSQNTNPVTLNAAGSAQIWTGNSSYKFILKTAAGTTIWTVDQVRGGGNGTIGTVANIAGLRNYPGTGMVNVIGYYSATLNSTPDGGGGNFLDIGAGVSGDDDGGVTIYDATTGHKWRRQFVNEYVTGQQFGGRGDCTYSGSTASCSDNTSSLQAAIDYAYSVRGAVLIPANSNGATETVYWISGTLNPKGVSIYGPSGAEGVINVADSNTKVVIRGSPSKDIFATGDPTSMGWVQPFQTFTIHDLALKTDNTVDASMSFPNRLPGKTCNDAVITSGSAILTSAAQCGFRPGDAGQHIRVYGAGVAAANLDTTISSWQSNTQVTLAATASTSVASAGHVYVAIEDMSVTQTVGNCAIAYDDATGTGRGAGKGYQDFGPNGASFYNLFIDNGGGGTYGTKQGGIFFQGGGSPYFSNFNNISIVSDFGIVGAMQNLSTPVGGGGGFDDFNHFNQVYLASVYQFSTWGGIGNTFESSQILSNYGPQILYAPGVATTPHKWTMDWQEHEAGLQTCVNNATNLRIDGVGHSINHFETPYCGNAATTTTQIDASSSTIAKYEAGTAGPLNLTGSFNDVTSGLIGPSVVNDTGIANQFKSCSSVGANSTPVGNCSETVAGSPVTAPLAHAHTALKRTADFIFSGMDAFFYNANDLFIYPSEMGNLYAPSTATIVADSTSESGQYLDFTDGGYILTHYNGSLWKAGLNLPIKKIRVGVRVKASTSIAAWSYHFDNFGSGCTSTPTTITTTWQTIYCVADGTGATPGAAIDINFTGSGSASDHVRIGWVGARPYDSSTVTTSLNINDGTPLTDNQGTGAKAQHSTGTTTTDHLAKFDSAGNTVDAGTTCASATVRTCSGSAPNQSCYETACNGTIHEWGTIQSGTLSGAWKQSTSLSFPLTFPTEIQSISCNPGSPGGSGDATNPVICQSNSASTSGATLYTTCVQEIGGGGCSATKLNVTLNWEAYGK